MGNGSRESKLVYGYYDTHEDGVFAYLEYKITRNEETDEEYALFCEYKWTGQVGEYIEVYEALEKEMQEMKEF